MNNNNQIENCLASELLNMLSEFNMGSLTKETILNYFSTFLLDSNINSDIVINVLERKEFGEEGKQEALAIKVNLGY